MGHTRRLAALLVAGGTIGSLGLVAPATASASAQLARPLSCVVALDKLEPGQTVSRIASEKCTSDPQEAKRLVSAGTKLMTLYKSANYDTSYEYASVDFIGTAGTCDAAGYGVRNIQERFNSSLWNDKLSSFKVFGACNEVGLYEHDHYNLHQNGRQQFYRGSQSYVGAYMNDRTTSFVVYHAS